MTVKKLTVENLKAMVKEAVALQMKQSASERRKKMEADKEKAKEKANESKSIKVTMEQLRVLVKEAVQSKLKESMMDGTPAIGDLVSANGKTGYVGDVKHGPDGSAQVAITRDGVRMEWMPAAAVQVMASSEELDELTPDEMGSIDGEMGPVGMDPGEDPQSELGRVSGHLDSKLLGKPTRVALGRRAGDLKNKLGHTDDEY